MCDWSGSDGKTLYGAHTDFTSSGSNGAFWNRGGLNPGGHASIAATSVASYDSTLTVQKLTEDSSNNTHSVGLAAAECTDQAAYNPFTYRLMAIAKGAERTRIVLRVTSPFSTISVDASVGFDLSGGNTGYDVVHDSNLTIVGQQMISLGSNFWACIFDFKFNTATTGLGQATIGWCPEIMLDSGSGTAARSTSYAGDGASGVYVNLVSLLPLAMWNSRSRVFFDDFADLSTIDLNNTKAPGFNWYVNNDFPNSSPAGFWHTKPVTLAEVFSMDQPSVMRMQTQSSYGNSSNFNCSCETVAYTSGSGLASLVGQYWAPPLIMDGYLTYDTVQVGYTFGKNTTLNNTSFWSAAAETLAGSPLDASGHYIEIDMTDVSGSQGSPVAQSSPIEWKNDGTTVASSVFHHGTPQNIRDFVRYTGVWLDAASGSTGASGWGLFMNFRNGQFVNGGKCIQAYNNSGTTHPSAGGDFSLADNQHLALFLWGTATVNNPPGPAALWDWVSVWQ